MQVMTEEQSDGTAAEHEGTLRAQLQSPAEQAGRAGNRLFPTPSQTNSAVTVCGVFSTGNLEMNHRDFWIYDCEIHSGCCLKSLSLWESVTQDGKQ